MKKTLFVTFGVLAILMSLASCAGHFVVKPTTPGSTVQGFRYYLPKPYLLVTNMTVVSDDGNPPQSKPAGSSDTSSSSKDKPKDNSSSPKETPQGGSVVTAKIVWLPDTANPYTVSSSGPGIGTFKGGLQLTNGWMLTNVNEESDAKVAETLTAVAGLVSGVLSPGGKVKGLGTELPKAVPFLYLFEIDPSNHRLTRVDTSPLDEALAHAGLHQDAGPPLEK